MEPQELGEFRIEGKLGQGAMGAVYRAHQTSLNRTVALKVLPPHFALNPEFIARFKNEAMAAATLNHPHIVQIYAAGESEGTHFFAMEYVDGETLGTRVERKGRLDPREAVAVAVYVARALDHAWKRAQIIHRDIKPDNIFLSREGEVKLGDLGLAKSLDAQAAAATQTGTSMGTPYYVSPEQARGDRVIDFRADIYSLGCTLFHILSGVTPYQGDSAMGVMLQHLTQPPPEIVKVWPECPPPIIGLLERMLRKDAGARHQSYEELIGELMWVSGNLRGSGALSSPETSMIVPIPRAVQGRVKRVALGIAASGVVILLTAGALIWMRREKGPTSVAEPQPKAAEFPGLSFAAKTSLPAASNTSASKEQPVVNSLGMKFVPVPGTNILICIHETRNGDYTAYAAENPGTDSMWRDAVYRGADLSQGADYPVINVSWDDAVAFCEWLTRKDGQTYRLPTDREWSFAVGGGLVEEERVGSDSPDAQTAWEEFPWGRAWPPPRGAGNYKDESFNEKFSKQKFLEGYTDGFPLTTPVMSFTPNVLGLYDLGGNVWEWCADWFDASKSERILRGAAWGTYHRAFIRSSHRTHARPDLRADANGFRCVLDFGGPAKQAASTPTGSPAAASLEAGFTSLFNGRDLTGWDGDAAFWSVKNGAILGKTTGSLDAVTFLVWTGGNVSDFDLRFRARLPSGNSGVQFRSQRLSDGKVVGYQADMVSHAPTAPRQAWWFGSLVHEGNSRSLENNTFAECGQRTEVTAAGRWEVGRTPRKPQEIFARYAVNGWNDYRILAQGNRFSYYINGDLTSECTDKHPAYTASGVLALQLRGPNAQVQVEFKDIQMRRMESNAGSMAPPTAAMQKPGTALVLATKPAQLFSGALAGTIWVMRDSSGDVYYLDFAQGGALNYEGPRGLRPNGKWRQDGLTVNIEINDGAAKLIGTLSGRQMRGSGSSTTVSHWTWEASPR